MAPFYSDRQRRYFFGVILPMMDFGGNILANHVLDPIAENMGWKKVKKKAQITKLKDAIKDSSHLKILKANEVDKISEANIGSFLESKVVDLLTDGLKTSGLSSYVSSSRKIFLSKKELNSIVKANFASRYGQRKRRNRKKEFHAGNDIGMLGRRGIDAPTPVGGVVIFSGCYNGYGNTVEVLGSDNRVRRFAHLKKSFVQPGDVLNAGDFVGEIGNSTGLNKKSGKIHLHYEKRANYLFRLKGKRKTSIKLQDVKKLSRKKILELTDNKKTRKFRKFFIDANKRFDDKTKLLKKNHAQSFDPQKESREILEHILEYERTKAIVKKLIRAYSKGKIAADKAAKPKISKTSKKKKSRSKTTQKLKKKRTKRKVK